MSKLTKNQLVAVVAKQAHLPKKIAGEVIDEFVAEIARTMKKGGKVVISGFGTFKVVQIEEREITPFGDHKRKQTVKTHRAIQFKVSTPLKRAVW